MSPRRRVATSLALCTMILAGGPSIARAQSSPASAEADARISEGLVLRRERRDAEALANFDRALTFNPAHPEKVYFNRALAREDMGDIKGAYADYRQASQLNPLWDKPKRELARFKVIPAKPVS